MGDQSVARPLPKKNTEQKQADIHALSEIRTHDPSIRAGEASALAQTRTY
jgi:hypothetical protein